MPPPLRYLRCRRCETVHALPERPDHCPRCATGELIRIGPADVAVVSYFAGTMR